MLPTFVIGLREGLEAALIVSIIATFLRRNGASLRGMWCGVSLGVAISIAVGVVLALVEGQLHQAQQEGMETVIGLVAVVFVTGMILWMRTHARFLKRDLEKHASEALTTGTTSALVVMAFLAVLREGFETAVFLLATFQSATSRPFAVVGAVLGLVVAVALGFGIYKGGVRINLARFFSVTGLFLILVAAGLVLNAFRTGHEAGWVTIGQGTTVDLSWLAPTGSIRSALVSGVLGIPRDPRVIEVLAWLCYLLPMLAIAFWPARYRPGAALARRLCVVGATGAVVLAAALALLVPLPSARVPASAPVQGGGTARLDVHGSTATITRAGTTYHLTRTSTDTWSASRAAGRLPSTIDVAGLLRVTGNRVPVGLDIHAAPGPYQATWTDRTRLTATTSGSGLVDAGTTGTLLLRLSGGGLSSPRVFSIDAVHWTVSPSYAEASRAAVSHADAARHERALWKLWFPLALLVAAAGLLRRARRRRTAPSSTPGSAPAPAAEQPTAQQPSPEGTAHHARSSA